MPCVSTLKPWQRRATPKHSRHRLATAGPHAVAARGIHQSASAGNTRPQESARDAFDALAAFGASLSLFSRRGTIFPTL